MAMDMFSTFDDHNKVLWDMNFMIWLIPIMMILTFINSYWLKNNLITQTILLPTSITKNLLQESNFKDIGGSMTLMASLIISIICLNLTGLSPYSFSMTSHLTWNYSLAMVIWMTVVLSSMSFKFTDFMAHLQPTGTPAILCPYLCIIELISLLVRPITLAVRITANLSTGHILMALLGNGFINTAALNSLLIMMIGTFYFMFEMAVCLIQAYIFTLLPILYSDEHPTHNN